MAEAARIPWGLHFTNHLARWSGCSWKSTGFVESLLTKGAQKFLDVGYGDIVAVRHEFQHHGERCNKKNVCGVESIPAVVVFDLSDLVVQTGYDSPLHYQVNERIEPERVLGWFQCNEMKDREFRLKVEEILT